MNDKDIIDSVVREFGPKECSPEDNERRILSLSIPREYKEKYDEIQMRSKQQFSKIWKEATIRLIEKFQSLDVG